MDHRRLGWNPLRIAIIWCLVCPDLWFHQWTLAEILRLTIHRTSRDDPESLEPTFLIGRDHCARKSINRSKGSGRRSKNANKKQRILLNNVSINFSTGQLLLPYGGWCRRVSLHLLWSRLRWRHWSLPKGRKMFRSAGWTRSIGLRRAQRQRILLSSRRYLYFH